jgi:hypothetical protein
MLASLAQFLDTRSVIALSHTSNGVRWALPSAKVILDERSSESAEDRRQLVMFQKSANRPMRYILTRQLHAGCSGSSYEPMKKNTQCITIQDRPSDFFSDTRAVLAHIPESVREVLMRGDVITCYTMDYFWDGKRLVDSTTVFDIPREFPPDYFSISQDFRFDLSIAKYRDQILQTCLFSSYRIMYPYCQFMITAGAREFHVKFMNVRIDSSHFEKHSRVEVSLDNVIITPDKVEYVFRTYRWL